MNKPIKHRDFKITDAGDRHPSKRKDKDKANPEKCGRTTRRDGHGDDKAGRPCRLAAGHGTPNRSGPCYLHGGLLPTTLAYWARHDQQKAAAKELQKLNLWGARRDDLPPIDALSEELSRTAGRVQVIEQHLAQLSEEELDTTKARGLVAELTAERGQLQRVAEAAERAGVTRKQVELAQLHGEQLARGLRGLFSDLELSSAQQAALPALVKWHLRGQPGDVPRPPKPSAIEPKPQPPGQLQVYRPEVVGTGPRVPAYPETPIPAVRPLSEQDRINAQLRAIVDRTDQERMG